MLGSRFAIIDFPLPGAPIIRRLCPPAAAKVCAEVEAAAAPHIKTGELYSSFSLKQGKVDWSISPSTDHDAAVEFGHYVYQDAQGRRSGRQGARYRTWVPGLNIMRGVVRANGGF